MISPIDAWAVKRALVGHDSTDTLPGVSRMLRPAVEHLRTLPSAEAREIAWQALLCICPFREQLARAVDDADPDAAPPEGGTGRRSAHLGDLAASAACRRFVWPGWIVRGEFNLLSADAKVGKTHLMLDLAQRFWFQLPMPDGSEEPPALGVTFYGDRCDYDTRPPSEPGPRRRGRPADRRASAIKFLDEKLADGPRKAAELIRTWEELGGNKGTLLNARNTMQADGRLSVQVLQRHQMWLRAQREEHQPTDAAVEGPEGGDLGQESADAHNHQQL